MFAVYAAFEKPDTVVIEVNGESREMTADQADALAADLTFAAKQARPPSRSSNANQ